ncbi:MAG TPA: hypothetical protein VG034_01775 [Acidimicrobiia bacterium]|jgi:hypothetical protein|nr:hypothetical protein [Acidimicrobiia bacterium]
MSMTIERPAVDHRDLILDPVEVHTGGPTIEAWLETMWGIRPGTSSPVSQPTTADLPAGIASWLHHLWGLAPLRPTEV